LIKAPPPSEDCGQYPYAQAKNVAFPYLKHDKQVSCLSLLNKPTFDNHNPVALHAIIAIAVTVDSNCFQLCDEHID
jgi:hypothetical protein